MYTGIWCGNLRERDHLKDPGVDGRIILDEYSRIGIGIDLAQDRERWLAIVIAVMNLPFP